MRYCWMPFSLNERSCILTSFSVSAVGQRCCGTMKSMLHRCVHTRTGLHCEWREKPWANRKLCICENDWPRARRSQAILMAISVKWSEYRRAFYSLVFAMRGMTWAIITECLYLSLSSHSCIISLRLPSKGQRDDANRANEWQMSITEASLEVYSIRSNIINNVVLCLNVRMRSTAKNNFLGSF